MSISTEEPTMHILPVKNEQVSSSHSQREVLAGKGRMVQNRLKETFTSAVPPHFKKAGADAFKKIGNDIRAAETPEKKLALLNKIQENNLEKGVASLIYNATFRENYLKIMSSVSPENYLSRSKDLTKILFGNRAVPKEKDYNKFIGLITEQIKLVKNQIEQFQKPIHHIATPQAPVAPPVSIPSSSKNPKDNITNILEKELTLLSSAIQNKNTSIEESLGRVLPNLARNSLNTASIQDPLNQYVQELTSRAITSEERSLVLTLIAAAKLPSFTLPEGKAKQWSSNLLLWQGGPLIVNGTPADFDDIVNSEAYLKFPLSITMNQIDKPKVQIKPNTPISNPPKVSPITQPNDADPYSQINSITKELLGLSSRLPEGIMNSSQMSANLESLNSLIKDFLKIKEDLGHPRYAIKALNQALSNHLEKLLRNAPSDFNFEKLVYPISKLQVEKLKLPQNRDTLLNILKNLTKIQHSMSLRIPIYYNKLDKEKDLELIEAITKLPYAISMQFYDRSFS
jgi:Txe/YoeB family toxin of Txe-Axe toxin-antitoxin module